MVEFPPRGHVGRTSNDGPEAAVSGGVVHANEVQDRQPCALAAGVRLADHRWRAEMVSAIPSRALSPMQPFIRRSFWTREQCNRIRTAMDDGIESPAEIYRGRFVVDSDVRLSFDMEPDEAIV